MTESPRTPRRLEYRLSWCAYVELVCDCRPGYSQVKAYQFVSDYLPSPFPNVGAYYDFAERNCGRVRTRKAEIWKDWHDREKKSGTSKGQTADSGDIEALLRLVGVRVTESPEGLGMTGLDGRPPKR